MNRGNYLAQTLPENLENNADYPDAEFVIVDYGDSWGVGYKLNENGNLLEKGQPLKEWLVENFRSEIESGHIKYVRTEQKFFRAAHAKNIAHRLAAGQILVGLDADNIIAEGFSEHLNTEYRENPDLVMRPHLADILQIKLDKREQPTVTDDTKKEDGQYRGIGGRIVISKENFLKLHGYDEKAIKGWAGDDDNFFDRTDKISLPYKAIAPEYYGRVLPNTDKERMENRNPKGKAASIQDLASRGSRFKGSLKAAIQQAKLEKSNLRFQAKAGANPGGKFGCGELAVLKPDLSIEMKTLTPMSHLKWVKSYRSLDLQSGTDLTKKTGFIPNLFR